MIFYESPHRIEETLKIMYEVLGNREIVIARELTKKEPNAWNLDFQKAFKYE